jgi:hypothetical protein
MKFLVVEYDRYEVKDSKHFVVDADNAKNALLTCFKQNNMIEQDAVDFGYGFWNYVDVNSNFSCLEADEVDWLVFKIS